MGEAYLVPGSVKNKPMIIHPQGFSYNTKHTDSIPVSRTGYYVANMDQVMKTYSYSGNIVAVEVDTVDCTATIYYSYNRTCYLYCSDFSQHKIYYLSTTYASFLRWNFQSSSGSGMIGNNSYWFKCILSDSMMTLYGTNTIYKDNVRGTITIQIYTVE